jgi:uncharacterized protein YqeY
MSRRAAGLKASLRAFPDLGAPTPAVNAPAPRSARPAGRHHAQPEDLAMLRERFSDTLKTAMKAGDKVRVSTIRLIQAALKDKDIEARGLGKEPLGDEEILAVLQKMVKQRQESITIYDANGRPELAEGERAEVAVIAEFMPKQLGEEETRAAVQAAIAETGAASVKDMGKVIAKLRADYAGQMDFGRASGLVKEALAKA